MAEPQKLSDSAKAFLDKYSDCINNQYGVVSPFEIIMKRDKATLESLMTGNKQDAAMWIHNRIEELNNEASEANVPKDSFNYVTNWLHKFDMTTNRMRSGMQIVQYFYNCALNGEGLAVAAELEDMDTILAELDNKKIIANRIYSRIIMSSSRTNWFYSKAGNIKNKLFTAANNLDELNDLMDGLDEVASSETSTNEDVETAKKKVENMIAEVENHIAIVNNAKEDIDDLTESMKNTVERAYKYVDLADAILK